MHIRIGAKGRRVTEGKEEVWKILLQMQSLLLFFFFFDYYRQHRECSTGVLAPSWSILSLGRFDQLNKNHGTIKRP